MAWNRQKQFHFLFFPPLLAKWPKAKCPPGRAFYARPPKSARTGLFAGKRQRMRLPFLGKLFGYLSRFHRQCLDDVVGGDVG
ncbi:MAG: hypothetical protein AB7V55_07880, partial [Oscillospiraceae bacterium]